MRFFTPEKEISYLEFASLLKEEAEILKSALGLEADFELDQENRLGLRTSFSCAIRLNPSSELDYHKKFFYKNSVYTQPLAKALGVKRGKAKPRVFDASAGTLKDSTLMLAMGLEVIAAERHPVAQALIQNCLRRENDLALEFIPADALEVLKTRNDFDVVYFDPMYEGKNEKAAPRKEMRIFREVVQADLDAKDCAQELRNSGKRLVIKRSSKADPLLTNPAVSFGKKSTVYDVYL